MKKADVSNLIIRRYQPQYLLRCTELRLTFRQDSSSDRLNIENRADYRNSYTPRNNPSNSSRTSDIYSWACTGIYRRWTSISTAVLASLHSSQLRIERSTDLTATTSAYIYKRFVSLYLSLIFLLLFSILIMYSLIRIFLHDYAFRG